MSKVKLTPSQNRGFRLLLDTQKNLFITGGPGTGKSFLIREFLNQANEAIPVLASTGAAAILVGGRTFHSYFGLGIMQGGPSVVYKKAIKDRRLKKRLTDVSTLIIDEVSMLSYETLDCAEKIARTHRASDDPWGGIRIITVGDFAQLPPIGDWDEKEWGFLGDAWERSHFHKVELKEVKRTNDKPFLKILEDIRWGKISEPVVQFLNERVVSNEEVEVGTTYIFPRRAETQAFNHQRLSEIEYPTRSFSTEYAGDKRYVKRLKQDAPIPEVLDLKLTARIMFRINDPKQRFVNGTIGTISDMTEDSVWVDVQGRRIKLEPFTFTVQNADGEEVASAKNFPVMLAYASTIHKIQGTTLEKVHVSLDSLWEPGQAYVALSRAQRGEDITLMGWDERSIFADEVVHEFYQGEN